jgi:hypothetical protein
LYASTQAQRNTRARKTITDGGNPLTNNKEDIMLNTFRQEVKDASAVSLLNMIDAMEPILSEADANNMIFTSKFISEAMSIITEEITWREEDAGLA